MKFYEGDLGKILASALDSLMTEDDTFMSYEQTLQKYWTFKLISTSPDIQQMMKDATDKQIRWPDGNISARIAYNLIIYSLQSIILYFNTIW